MVIIISDLVTNGYFLITSCTLHAIMP